MTLPFRTTAVASKPATWDTDTATITPVTTTPARLNVARYARNGFMPGAPWETLEDGSENFVPYSCPKELFSSSGWLDFSLGSVSSERPRFRFAGHTGPLLDHLKVRMIIARQSGAGTDPYVRLVLSDITGGTTYATVDAHYGAAANSDDTPAEWSFIDVDVPNTVPADTDVFGVFYDEGYARLLSAVVYEASQVPSFTNGYVAPQSISAGGSIYAGHRRGAMELARSLWERGAARCFGWCSNVDADADALGNATTTDKNVIDASTVASATSLGMIFDGRYCNTEALATVPVRFAVYASCLTEIFAAKDGTVKLKDSTGATLASITVNGAAAWYQTTLNLPATLSKYDVTAAVVSTTGGPSVIVNAASVYQHR